MPIIVTTTFPHDSDQPGHPGDEATPPMDPSSPDASSTRDGISSDRLSEIIKRLESGFYDSPEVREQIARKALKDLDP